MGFKRDIGETDYETLVKAFKKFSSNSDLIEFNKWHITYDSLERRFEKVFGVKNEFFLKIFYYYLTEGTEMKWISLHQFIKTMSPFLTDDVRVMMKAVFKFYDLNHSGYISMVNLMQAQATIS
jgi:Ca2+-binding EF-hand superfamily protein